MSANWHGIWPAKAALSSSHACISILLLPAAYLFKSPVPRSICIVFDLPFLAISTNPQLSIGLEGDDRL